MPCEPATLDGLLRAYEQAGRNKDIEACAELIAEDAAFFFSSASACTGKDAVLAALQKNFDSIENDTYHTQDVVWLTRNTDSAVCVYWFAWAGTIAGKPVSGEGRGTSAYRYDGGKWLIVHEHLSHGRFAPVEPS